MRRLIKRAPDKVCDNVIGMAAWLTLFAMIVHVRTMWRFVRYGEWE